MFGISLIKVHFVLPTHQVANDERNKMKKKEEEEGEDKNETHIKREHQEQQIGTDKLGCSFSNSHTHSPCSKKWEHQDNFCTETHNQLIQHCFVHYRTKLYNILLNFKMYFVTRTRSFILPITNTLCFWSIVWSVAPSTEPKERKERERERDWESEQESKR